SPKSEFRWASAPLPAARRCLVTPCSCRALRTEWHLIGKRQQIIHRLARLIGSFENGAIVLPQYGQPRAEIIGMAHGRDDTESGAKKSRSEFGEYFFPRIKRSPEITRLIAAKACLVSRPVAQFVQGRAVVVDL